MAISDTIFLFIYYFFIMAISDAIFHYGHFRCHFLFIYYFFIMAISDAIFFSYIIFSLWPFQMPFSFHILFFHYGTVSNIPFFAFHELHTVVIVCLTTVLSLRVKGAGLHVWYNLILMDPLNTMIPVCSPFNSSYTGISFLYGKNL